jgi:glycosyltransferase involved in cell wall biosynthesis
MLEAMIMGALPIQTNPGGATSEWVDHGVNGLILPSSSPEHIASSLRWAVRDDRLVDAADRINLDLTMRRVDESVIQPRVIDLYRQAMMPSRPVQG